MYKADVPKREEIQKDSILMQSKDTAILVIDVKEKLISPIENKSNILNSIRLFYNKKENILGE